MMTDFFLRHMICVSLILLFSTVLYGAEDFSSCIASMVQAVKGMEGYQNYPVADTIHYSDQRDVKGEDQLFHSQILGARAQLMSDMERLRQNLADLAEFDSDPELRKLAEEEAEEILSSIALSSLPNYRETLISELDPLHDHNSFELEIYGKKNAGGGGQEFFRALEKLYAGLAKEKGWRFEKKEDLSDSSKSVWSVSGQGVYRYFKHEAGAHTVRYREERGTNKGKAFTDVVGVALFPGGEVQTRDFRDDEVTYKSLKRSKGPGGQNVNKNATSVRATHNPTGLSVLVSDQKSQKNNKELARARLKALVLEEESNRLAELRKNQREKAGRIRPISELPKVRNYNVSQGKITFQNVDVEKKNLPGLRSSDEGDNTIEQLVLRAPISGMLPYHDNLWIRNRLELINSRFRADEEE